MRGIKHDYFLIKFDALQLVSKMRRRNDRNGRG